MIAHKVQRIRRDHLRSNQPLRRLPVIRELEEMQHIGVFLPENSAPAIIRHGGKFTPQCSMPLLEVLAGQDGVGVGDRTEHIIRTGGEGLRGEDAVGFGFFVGILFPFDIS